MKILSISNKNVQNMVTQNILRMCKDKKDFSDIKFGYPTILDLNKCLKQIKLQISLRTCAPIYELPSNISTMV